MEPLPPDTPPIEHHGRAEVAQEGDGDAEADADGDDIMIEDGDEAGQELPPAQAALGAGEAAVEARTPDGSDQPADAGREDYPSVEELVAKARAPVKREFLRTGKRRALVESSVEPWDDGRSSLPRPENGLVQQNGDAAASKVSVERKSKRAMKKERLSAKASPEGLCAAVARTGDVNSCQYASKCRFNHDLEKFLAQKPPDLEGPCPFSGGGNECPYGLGCRFAGAHVRLVEQDAAANLGDTKRDAPVMGVELNALDKDFQKRLWKNQVDFVKADAKLAAMGLLGKARQNPNKKKSQELAGETLDGTLKDRVSDVEDVEMTAPLDTTVTDGIDVEMTAAADSNAGCFDATSLSGNGCHDKKRNSDLSVEVQAAEEHCQKRVKGLEGHVTGGVRDESENQGITADPSGKNCVEEILVAESVNTVSEHVEEGCGLVKDDKELRLHAREKKLIDFRGKLYVAPLTTVGNLPFRRLCKQLGADITCGEMAMCTKLLQGHASEWALLRRHPSEDIFGVQICGSYPDTLSRTAEVIEQACTVDFVDINLGCPIDIVVNKGAGSCLLTKPARLAQIVTATAAAMDNPLTVKVRMGYYEGKNCAHSYIPQLRDWGAMAVTVHGRTRQQRYSKLANWDYIYECASQAPDSLQVIGNGDIFSYTDWNEHILTAGSSLSTCMLARGALIKPWLLTEIKEQRHWDISSGERLELLKDYVRYGLEHWGSDLKGVETTRHFLLEWLSYTHRYIPVDLLEVIPQRLNWRPPCYEGRNELETLMASESAVDWVRISEMLLGPAPKGFKFTPKHKSNAYDKADNG